MNMRTMGGSHCSKVMKVGNARYRSLGHGIEFDNSQTYPRVCVTVVKSRAVLHDPFRPAW